MNETKKQKEVRREWEKTAESGYQWPSPKRISVYIFNHQLKMMKQIAEEKEMRLRHVFLEAFQWYIATHLQNKEEEQEPPKNPKNIYG